MCYVAADEEDVQRGGRRDEEDHSQGLDGGSGEEAELLIK